MGQEFFLLLAMPGVSARAVEFAAQALLCAQDVVNLYLRLTAAAFTGPKTPIKKPKKTPKPKTLNPKTLNPKTLNPKPQNPKTLNPNTLNPKTLNPINPFKEP